MKPQSTAFSSDGSPTSVITELWAFVSVDDDGVEGLVAAPFGSPDNLLPLIAADRARLDSLRPIARQIARATGAKIRLLKLTGREDQGEVVAWEN